MSEPTVQEAYAALELELEMLLDGVGTIGPALDAARALALATHDALCHWCWRSSGSDDEMSAAVANCDERKKLEALGR